MLMGVDVLVAGWVWVREVELMLIQQGQGKDGWSQKFSRPKCQHHADIRLPQHDFGTQSSLLLMCRISASFSGDTVLFLIIPPHATLGSLTACDFLQSTRGVVSSVLPSGMLIDRLQADVWHDRLSTMISELGFSSPEVHGIQEFKLSDSWRWEWLCDDIMKTWCDVIAWAEAPESFYRASLLPGLLKSIPLRHVLAPRREAICIVQMRRVFDRGRCVPTIWQFF